MPPEAMFDIKKVDCSKVVVDIEGIRKVNPQRYEMEHLTAVVHIDPVEHLAIGYKDVRHDEFWVRGHMPGYPLMPGVLICEAAAQLCGFVATQQKWMAGDFLGFGGMENVRFRGPVRPGDRLVIMVKPTKINRRQVISMAQAFVGETMVFQGDIIGVPLSRPKEG